MLKIYVKNGHKEDIISTAYKYARQMQLSWNLQFSLFTSIIIIYWHIIYLWTVPLLVITIEDSFDGTSCIVPFLLQSRHASHNRNGAHLSKNKKKTRNMADNVTETIMVTNQLTSKIAALHGRIIGQYIRVQWHSPKKNNKQSVCSTAPLKNNCVLIAACLKND